MYYFSNLIFKIYYKIKSNRKYLSFIFFLIIPNNRCLLNINLLTTQI
jgi:hypothetical protein